MLAALLGFLSGCSNPPPREINRFQAPPPEGSELAAQLDAIPGMRRLSSGQYAGLEEIVAEYLPIGSREDLLIAFLNREGFSKPLIPDVSAIGLNRKLSLSGQDGLDAFAEGRQRRDAGASLSGTTLRLQCRNGGTSRYRVTWRSNSGRLSEIYSDTEFCIINL